MTADPRIEAAAKHLADHHMGHVSWADSDELRRNLLRHIAKEALAAADAVAPNGARNDALEAEVARLQAELERLKAEAHKPAVVTLSADDIWDLRAKP